MALINASYEMNNAKVSAEDGTSGNTVEISMLYPGGIADTEIAAQGSFSAARNHYGGLRTTNATATNNTNPVLNLPDAGMGTFTAKVMAKQDGADVARYWVVSSGFRSNAGTITALGAIQTHATQFDAGAATWLADFQIVSGIEVRLRLTGQAATTIDWYWETNVEILYSI
jgi:hypothetical protein